jgi:hypothetical protein
MPTPTFTPDIIIAAITGFEVEQRHLDVRKRYVTQQIDYLRAMLPSGRTEPATTQEAPTGKRRKISAAARRRMKEGQQRRWAKIRGESEPSSPSVKPEPVKPKRKLSAAGKANIVAALKKRWAAKKAAAKTAPAVTKKGTARKTFAKKPAKKKTAAKNAPVNVAAKA